MENTEDIKIKDLDNQLKQEDLIKKRRENKMLYITIWAGLIGPFLSVYVSFLISSNAYRHDIEKEQINYNHEAVKKIITEDNIADARLKILFLIKSGMLVDSGGKIEREVANLNDEVQASKYYIDGYLKISEAYNLNGTAKLSKLIPAISSLLVAASFNPKNPDYYSNIAIAYSNLAASGFSPHNNNKLSLSYAIKAHELDTANDFFLSQMAGSQYYLGLYADGLVNINSAIKKNPKDSTYIILRENLNTELGKQQ